MVHPSDLRAAIRKRLPEVIALRRDLHRFPELSDQEHRTGALVADQLLAAGLEVMREVSMKKGIPFWNFFNVMPYGPHADPTEAQLRWQVFTSIAYGAKGVLYFCYWTPRGDEFPKGGAIIAADGRKTRHYDQARRINRALRNLGPTIMKLSSLKTVRVKPADDAATLPTDMPVKSLTPGDYLIGDRDGVVIIPGSVAADVVTRTEEVMQTENKVRAAILGGMDPVEAYLKYGKF